MTPRELIKKAEKDGLPPEEALAAFFMKFEGMPAKTKRQRKRLSKRVFHWECHMGTINYENLAQWVAFLPQKEI